MTKSEAKAKRKAHAQKKKVVAKKDARKFTYIVVGIAAVLLVIMYLIFRSQFA